MKITVVIVTFNGEFWIEKCINSILKSNYPLDIIVVDNCSQDATLSILKQFPSIELIKSNFNLGFGKANNIGVQKALKNGSDAVLLLNQDTRIFENTISNLVDYWKNNTECGILSPMHFSNDAVTLDANFEMYYKKRVGANVEFVNAAAWLVTMKCINKVGFFEPIFSHYGEDRNFCNRVIFHNFKIGIVETSKIVHDRTIIRNFRKDIVQSRYGILNSFLNINFNIFESIFISLKSVFGFPKYFNKFYNLRKSLVLFFNLIVYFVMVLFHLNLILKIRANSKSGTNGKDL